MRQFRIALLASFSLVVPANAFAQQHAGDGYAPRFEEAPCPFDAGPDVLEQVRCGWLTVPQNRAEPDGRLLRLAVAVLSSTSPTPRPDPVVFLSGGPGGKTVEHMPRYSRLEFFNRLRVDRDVVFFDQRGTGYSEPEFCPEVSEESFRILFLGLNASERISGMQVVLADVRR